MHYSLEAIRPMAIATHQMMMPMAPTMQLAACVDQRAEHTNYVAKGYGGKSWLKSYRYPLEKICNKFDNSAKQKKQHLHKIAKVFGHRPHLAYGTKLVTVIEEDII